MTVTDLVNYLSDKTMIKKGDCEIIVDVILDGIKKGIKEDGGIKLRGIGSIRTIIREEHVAKNPKTGEMVNVPARRYMKFLPSRLFKNEIREVA